MARITDADVEELIDVDSSISLTPFITAANELVTELCTDSDYTDARLAIIEAWLAAHFYVLRDQAVDTEKAGSVSVKYQYRIGLMLQQTKQGQTAMILDTAGNLAALSKRAEEGEAATVSISWMGEDYDSEEDDE
jgi:hypothetical protein